jgi:hypothetical protein
MGVGKTVYKGEVETGVIARFCTAKNESPQSPVGASLLAKAPVAAPRCPKWKAKITRCKDFMTKSTGKTHEIAFLLIP